MPSPPPPPPHRIVPLRSLNPTCSEHGADVSFGFHSPFLIFGRVRPQIIPLIPDTSGYASLLPWPEGALLVRLKGARRLPLVDLGHSIDPFFRLRIDGQSLESESQRRSNTRDPRYDELFTLPLLDLKTDRLLVELWDWNPLGAVHVASGEVRLMID